MLTRIQSSIRDTSIFSLLLFVFIFIFALLGMELFAYTVFFDIDEELVVGTENIQEAYVLSGRDYLIDPLNNFNTIGQSIVCVFAVVMGDDWQSKASLYIRAGYAQDSLGMVLAYFFFTLLMISGHIFLNALLTALLLKNFEQTQNEQYEEQQQKKLKKRSSDSDSDSSDEEDDNEIAGEKWKRLCLYVKDMFNSTFTGDQLAYQREKKA